MLSPIIDTIVCVGINNNRSSPLIFKTQLSHYYLLHSCFVSLRMRSILLLVLTNCAPSILVPVLLFHDPGIQESLLQGEIEAEINQDDKRVFPEGSWSICNRIFRKFRRYPDNGVMWNLELYDQITKLPSMIMLDAQNGNVNLEINDVREAIVKVGPEDLRFGQGGEMKNQHWFHSCVTFNNETEEFSVYTNGRFTGSKKLKFASQKDRAFRLWVGTERYNFENKLIGMQSSLNLFSTALDENIAVDITGCKYDLSGDVIDGNNTDWTLTSERVEEISIEFDDICPKYEFKVFVIANPMSSRVETMDLCTKLGLEIVVPDSKLEYRITYNQSAFSTAMEERCSGSKRQRL